MTLAAPVDRPAAAPPAPCDPGLRKRALELLQTEIDFIPNAVFRRWRGDNDTPLVQAVLRDAAMLASAPSDLPAHLRRMCAAKLLTPEQETALFRRMNYLKYRANILRSRLDPDCVDAEAVAAIESLLGEAEQIREHLMKANMRLVISVVKKFVTPQQSFDDLLSDGVFTLMQAVEKFDYDRGFRFSTYAYRSIARNAYRTVTSARKEEARFTRDAEQWAFAASEEHSSSATLDQVWSDLRSLLTKMLNRLDRRERFIVRSRYALGAHRKVRTFQSLADKLGVSKERVRQLEQRAVGKLRKMADELKIDDLLSAAIP